MLAHRPYRFFFSYSWKNRGRPLERFFDDLVAEVRKRVGGETEAIAFRDRVTMKAGSDWPDGLLEALKSSQVLIYLLSTDYIQSEYCGKELQVFRERAGQYRNSNPASEVPLFIQPVLWVPVSGELPKSLGRVQPEDDAYPAEYAARGLESLAKQRDKTMYRRCIETLAVRIEKAAAGDRLAPLAAYDRIERIPNAFLDAEPAPPPPPNPRPATEVQCVYVAANASELKRLAVEVEDLARSNTACYGEQGGWYWQPFNPPVPATIGSLVQQMLTEFRYREIPFSGDIDAILNALRTAADSDQIVLLVVDAWSAFLTRYAEFLRKFDTSIPWNNAVIVPWNEGDQETSQRHAKLEAQIRLLFRSKYHGSQTSPFFKPRINGAEELRTVIRTVLEIIRSDIETYRAAQLQIKGRPLAEIRSARQESNV